mgnify:CR=1 FL=1
MRDFDNNWDIEDSKHLYQVGRWSDGYFSINSKGHLCVLPHKDESKPTIDIMSVINEAKKEEALYNEFKARQGFDALEKELGKLDSSP